VKILISLYLFAQLVLHADGIEFGGIKFDSAIGPAISLYDTYTIKDTNNSIAKTVAFISTEVGYTGGKLQVGYGKHDFISRYVKLSLLRTWNNPIWVNADQTYLGAELQGTFLVFNLSLGIYQHIQGDNSSQPRIGTVSVGFGW